VPDRHGDAGLGIGRLAALEVLLAHYLAGRDLHPGLGVGGLGLALGGVLLAVGLHDRRDRLAGQGARGERNAAVVLLARLGHAVAGDRLLVAGDGGSEDGDVAGHVVDHAGRLAGIEHVRAARADDDLDVAGSDEGRRRRLWPDLGAGHEMRLGLDGRRVDRHVGRDDLSRCSPRISFHCF
jgi:hypothetical protein